MNFNQFYLKSFLKLEINALFREKKSFLTRTKLFIDKIYIFFFFVILFSLFLLKLYIFFQNLKIKTKLKINIFKIKETYFFPF